MVILKLVKYDDFTFTSTFKIPSYCVLLATNLLSSTNTMLIIHSITLLTMLFGCWLLCVFLWILFLVEVKESDY